MKTKKEMWNFVELPHIPKITRSERKYWRAYLPKVMKEGVELEFNLPEQKRSSCGGSSNMICVCNFRSECHQLKDCALHISEVNSPFAGLTKCSLPRQLVCRRFVDGKCKEGNEDCDTCTKYSSGWFECIKQNCLNFVPRCWNCNAVKDLCRDCDQQKDDIPDPEIARNKIREKLKPTGRVDLAGKSGIYDVTTDGSLVGGGLELISTGRRPTFNTLYSMAKEMLEAAKTESAYINERCGIHIHLLTGYYSTGNKRFANELERPMPQIILANLHQLIRRYQAALVWMTSCLPSEKHLTRWEKFRIGIQDLSPMETSMSDLKKKQHSICSGLGNGKYGFLSYSGKKLEERTKFNNKGDVEIFHVEFRVPDACWNPSIIAAWSYLIYAILIRAVDFSIYGVMEYAQSPEESTKLKEEYKALCNNCPEGWGDDRVSHTSKASRYFERYIEDSESLLEILKPVLLAEEPVYGILKDLAAKPISLRRLGGETFENIETTMEKYIPEYHNDNLLANVDESIDLSIFTDCSSLEEWIDHVVVEIVKPTKEEKGSVLEKIRKYIQKEIDSSRMNWDETIKTLVIRR